MTRSISLAMAVLLLFAAVVHAATIRVPDDQPTIQAGVDASSPGDEVVVADGTCYFGGSVDRKVYALDAATGSESWKLELGPAKYHGGGGAGTKGGGNLISGLSLWPKPYR